MKKIYLLITLCFLLSLSIVYSQEYNKSLQYFREHFISNYNNLDKIEGIWKYTEKISHTMIAGKNEPINIPLACTGYLIIKKSGSDYYSYHSEYLDSNIFNDYIIDEPHRYRFTKTTMDGVYLVNAKALNNNYSWNDGKIQIMHDGFIKFNFRILSSTKAITIDSTEKTQLNSLDEISDDELFELSESYSIKNRVVVTVEQYSIEMTKLFPTIEDLIKSSLPTHQKSSATGFAVEKSGYILTNYHVVKNASKIIIRGVNGEFENGLEANIVTSDPRNDLVLLKIIDNVIINNFTPFVINSNLADLGETVYTLGYPLRSSMGDDIKLTNGIISSKSGYQGDITTYQVSIPVQPGNSGGPVFNKSGNIIGIISSKLEVAENASYAVKSQYIKLLLDNSDIKLNNDKVVNTQTVINELIKKIIPFVYIIEVE